MVNSTAMTSKKYKITISKTTMAELALFMFLCSDIIKSFLLLFISNLTICNYLPIVFIYLPVVYILFKGGFKAWDFVIILLMVAIGFYASYILYPDNAYYFTRKTYGVLYRVLRPDRAVYGYLFIRLLPDKKLLLKTLKVSSYVLMVYYGFTMISALRTGYWVEYNSKEQLVHLSYSLVFGYDVILPMLVFMYLAIKERKLRYYLMSILGFFYIIVGGSRGALICMAVFVAVFVLKNWKIWSKNKLFIFAGFCVVAFCLFFAFGGASTIISFMKSMGIESRTVNAMLEGTISDDHGRKEIWAAAIKMIKEGPIFGYGLYGDRPVISRYHYGGYPHNIFLEILINFGVLLGVIIIAALIIGSIKMLFFAKDEEWRNLFLIFFACSCELFLSMSLWYVDYFWMAIAIGVCYHKERKAALRQKVPAAQISG